MFTLLGLTIERKKDKLNEQFEDKVAKIYCRLNQKQKQLKIKLSQENIAKN